MPRGIVAAGHEVTAAAGARVLARRRHAVDAAIAAMLTSWVAEPLLTGPGAGGYLLVAGPGREPTLLDFFVAAPGFGAAGEPGALVRGPRRLRRRDRAGVPRRRRVVWDVRLSRRGGGGGAALGLDGAAGPRRPRGGARAHRRRGHPGPGPALPASWPGIALTSPEGAAAFVPGGRPPQAGERLALPELADAIARLGSDEAAPFYTGDIAAAVAAWVGERGGLLTAEDLATYAAVPRAPARVSYRGDAVLTNPPPSAGGTLLALALGLLDRTVGPPRLADIVDAMATAQDARTDAFVEGLAEPGFLDRFLSSRLGATTHISVVDGEGRAASVTCTNGEGSGLVVPGTGIHVNNIMGEADLSPLGFHHAPPGGGCRR